MPAGFQAFGNAEGYVGSAAFTPGDLSALQCWYVIADATTSGGAVTGVPDRKASGHALAPIGAAGTRPAYNAASANFNSLPSATFVAASGQGLITGPWTPLAGTIFMAARWTAVGTTVISSYDASGAGEFYQNGAVTNVHFNGATDFGGVVTDCRVPHVWAVDDVPGVNAGHIYQSTITATLTGSVGTYTRTLFAVGIRGDGALPADCEIAEVFGVAGVASLTDRTKAMQYLGTKYGITIGA